MASSDTRPLPAALRSKNPVRWLQVFGPGAIIASLTIGTGELIFSSRGGAIFGYRILFLFGVIAALKWALVYSMARHMVLTGVHPFRRWLEIPYGPRGWLPAVLFVFAVVCIPIWVSFHASVIGDLLAGLTQTKGLANGATIHLWGGAVLLLLLFIALQGGYVILERIQLIVVTAMLGAVLIALWLLQPDWWQLLIGAFVPQPLNYPQWLLESDRPLLQEVASRPLWVEASIYVGVVGGASYDYLAYVSFLREKRWGRAGAIPSAEYLTRESIQGVRAWLRAPLVDSLSSFFIVVLFSATFVASGWLVLAPQHEIPGDGNFLELQAQFVTTLHPWLRPLYLIGALLTMLGTLYGTMEVAPVMLCESCELLRTPLAESRRQFLRWVAIVWVSGGALLILLVSFFYQRMSGQERPPGLTTLLIPASLFTGVLSCGIVCLLNLWIDRWLPSPHRSPWPLKVANALAGCLFLILGLKGYWDFGGYWSLVILAGTVAAGFFVAQIFRRQLKGDMA